MARVWARRANQAMSLALLCRAGNGRPYNDSKAPGVPPMSPLLSPRHRLLPWLSALSLLALTTGCEPEPRHVGGGSTPKAPASASAPAKPAEGGPILGKTTTDIKK